MKKKIFILIPTVILVIYALFFHISWSIIEKGSVKNIEKYLKFKSKIALNSTNKDGYSLFNVVLKSTSQEDNYELIEFLASKNLKKKKMISPYTSLVEGLGEIDEVKLQRIEKIGILFKEKGYNDFPDDKSLLLALEKNNYKLFETLLKAGVNVNQKNELGETAIFYIIKNHYKHNDELNRAMKILNLKELPDKNKLSKLYIRDEGKVYSQELMVIKKAAEYYAMHLKALDLLRNYKADVNIANDKGISPIKYAYDSDNKVYLNKLEKFNLK